MTNPYDPTNPAPQGGEETTEFGHYGLDDGSGVATGTRWPQEGLPGSADGSGFGYPQQQVTNPLAIWSLVASFFIPLLGIILGHISLRQIKRTGQGGRGMALAGTIVGYVFTLLGVVAIALFFTVGAAVNKSLGSIEETSGVASELAAAAPLGDAIVDGGVGESANLASEGGANEIDALVDAMDAEGQSALPRARVRDQNCAAAFDYMDAYSQDPTLENEDVTPEVLLVEANLLRGFANDIEEPELREEILAVATIYETGDVNATIDPVKEIAVSMMPVYLINDCLAAGNLG